MGMMVCNSRLIESTKGRDSEETKLKNSFNKLTTIASAIVEVIVILMIPMTRVVGVKPETRSTWDETSDGKGKARCPSS